MVNKLVASQMTDIENGVTITEGIFIDEINLLLKNKIEFNNYQKKANYKRESVLAAYED